MLFRFRCSFKRTKIILFLNLQAFIFIIFVENIFSMQKYQMVSPSLRQQREFFGKRMQQIRFAKNIKMNTLSIYTKMTEANLYAFEHGTVSPSLDSMAKIFKVFGITFDEFFHIKDFQQEIK